MKKIQIAGILGSILLSFVLLSCSVKSSPGRYSQPEFLMMAMGRSIYDLNAYEFADLTANNEEYVEEFDPSNFDRIVDNPFRRVEQYPLSTFSIDVDTAGYSMTRRYIEGNRLPPKSAVRIEELINYFDYDYSPPNDEKPFAVYTEVSAAPWNSGHLLARIAIKGKEFPAAKRPKVNLVFLLDVSGSMDPPNRLPLVISSMKLLVNELNATDKIAICVYAGAAGTILPPTSCDNKNTIIAALDKLKAGGSTAGGAGIQLAYNLAEQTFDPLAVNRVILCTDGDFNVGITNRGDLVDLITEKAKTGVYLTVLGFGMDNFQDSTLKQLATKGNGNYGYIDTIEEANKILVKQLSGTLVTIANDVKIQVEFNPATIGAYRLIGYENRVMRDEEFNDDSVDAGDIGAGHSVTAFYELIPSGHSDLANLPGTDPLKYQTSATYEPTYTDELLTAKIRYKLPTENESSLLSFPVAAASVRKAGEESLDFRFATSVASFGMLLRDSPHKGTATYSSVIDLAQSAIGKDESGYRKNFVEMVQKAAVIK
jgi:Ca-activated chloride channel family protein